MIKYLPGPLDEEATLGAFDGYEVSLCVTAGTTADDEYTEQVDSPKRLVEWSQSGEMREMLFSVYGHFPGGGVHCFADAVVTAEWSYEQARDYALRLAYTIDGGRTKHGVDDRTFDLPA